MAGGFYKARHEDRATSMTGAEKRECEMVDVPVDPETWELIVRYDVDVIEAIKRHLERYRHALIREGQRGRPDKSREGQRESHSTWSAPRKMRTK